MALRRPRKRRRRAAQPTRYSLKRPSPPPRRRTSRPSEPSSRPKRRTSRPPARPPRAPRRAARRSTKGETGTGASINATTHDGRHDPKPPRGGGGGSTSSVVQDVAQQAGQAAGSGAAVASATQEVARSTGAAVRSGTASPGASTRVRDRATPTSRVFDPPSGVFDKPSEVRRAAAERRRQVQERQRRRRATAYENVRTSAILERADEAGALKTKYTRQPINPETAKQDFHRVYDSDAKRIVGKYQAGEIGRAEARARLEEAQKRAIESVTTREPVAALSGPGSAVYRRRLRRVQRIADDVRSGDRRYADLPAADREAVKPYLQEQADRRAIRRDERRDAATTSIGERIGGALSSAYEFASGADPSQQDPLDRRTLGGRLGDYWQEKALPYLRDYNDTQRATAGPSSVPQALDVLGVDATKGLTNAILQLQRPKNFVMDNVAKALAGAGVGDEEFRRTAEKAPGGAGAFTADPSAEQHVSGGEILSGVDLPEQGGIALDLALDPTMYVGAGLVRPATKLLPRIAEKEGQIRAAGLADDVFGNETVAAARDRFFRTGQDPEQYLAHLENAVGDVKLPHPRRQAVRAETKAVRDEFDQFYTNQLTDKADSARRLTVGGETMTLPEEALQISTEAAFREGALRRVTPGFRFAIGNPLRPLDRPWVTGDLKIGEHLSQVKLPILPRGALYNRVGRKNFATLEEITHAVSRNRSVKEAIRVSFGQKTTWSQNWQHVIDEALAPIMKRNGGRVPSKAALVNEAKEARLKVGLYAQLRESVRDEATLDNLIEEWGGKTLTAEERQVLHNADAIYASQAKQGLTIGHLQQEIPYYTPHFWVKEADTHEAYVDPLDPVQSTSQGLGIGSKMAAARHRTYGSTVQKASEGLMSDAAHKLFGVPKNRAGEFADSVWRNDPDRVILETLARDLARGQRIEMDSLPGNTQRVVLNELHQEKPLFKQLESTDGRLVLSDDVEKLTGRSQLGGRAGTLPIPRQTPHLETPLQTERARLYAAEQDLARVEEAIKNRPADDEVMASLRDMEDRLRTQVQDSRRAENEMDAAGSQRQFDLADEDAALGAQMQQLEQHMMNLDPNSPDFAAAVAAYDIVKRDRDVLAAERELWLHDNGFPELDEALGKLEDRRDYYGRLSDFRDPQAWPVLDVTSNLFNRSSMDAVNAAQHSRWKAVDAHFGKTTAQMQDEGFEALNDAGTKWRDPMGGIWENPVLDDDAMGNGIKNALGEDSRTFWPQEVKDDLKFESMRLGEGTYKQVFEEAADNMFRRFMSTLRFGATVPFPAYHIRNAISDVLKSIQADTGVVFHPLSSAKLIDAIARRENAGTIRLPLFGRLRISKGKIKLPHTGTYVKPEEFIFMMDLFGIRSGQHLAEFMQLARTGRGFATTRERVQRLAMIGPNGPIGKRLLEYGARREDIFRMLTFQQRLRANGGDVADAAFYMIRHHFDYNDLSRVEKNTIRNLFFFYTWYRKNIPLQFAELIARPGFFSGVTTLYKDAAAGETPLNQDWSKFFPWAPDMSGPVPRKLRGTIPDYMFNPLSAIATNWNGHAAAFAFGAPWADMNLIGNILAPGEGGVDAGIRQVLQMTNPLMAAAWSVGLQSSVLTGARQPEYTATLPFAADVLDWLGVPIVTDQNGVKRVPTAVATFLNTIPFFGRSAASFTPNTSSERAKDSGFLTQNRNLVSLLTGVNTRVSVSPERLDAAWGLMWDQKRLGELNPEIADISGRDLDPVEEEKSKQEARKKIVEWAAEKGIPWVWLRKHAVGLTNVYIPKDAVKAKPDPRDFGDGLGGNDPFNTDAFGTSLDDLGRKQPETKTPPDPSDPGSKEQKRRTKELHDAYDAKVKELAKKGTPPGFNLPVGDVIGAVGSLLGITPAAAEAATVSQGQDKARYFNKANYPNPDEGRAMRPAEAERKAKYTPAQRKKARRMLAKAARRSVSSEALVPSIVPPQYREALVKWGSQPEFEAIAKQYGITGPELMAKVVTGESGWNPAATSSAGAKSWTQFIDSTRDDFIERYGFDPTSGDFEDAVKGTFLHMTDYQSTPGIAGYNPGMENYTDYILGQDVGPNVRFGHPSEPIPQEVRAAGHQVLGPRESRRVIREARSGATGGGEAPVEAPSKRVLRKWIKMTEAPAEVAAEEGVPVSRARIAVNKMDPTLQAALVRLGRQTGVPVEINEGFRTTKRANEFPSGTASQHHQGFAADVNNHASYPAEDLAKAGLTNTAVAGEPWHFQPTVTPSSSGGSYGVSVPAASSVGSTGAASVAGPAYGVSPSGGGRAVGAKPIKHTDYLREIFGPQGVGAYDLGSAFGNLRTPGAPSAVPYFPAEPGTYEASPYGLVPEAA